MNMANFSNSNHLICDHLDIEKREEQETLKDEDEEKIFSYSMQLTISNTLPMALHRAIELGEFEVFQKDGKGGSLSAKEILSRLTSINYQKFLKFINNVFPRSKL